MLSTSLKTCWAFDVDGVVADTRGAVRKAYSLAGVTQPESAWGVSWKKWLPELVGERAEDVHLEKQRHYESLISNGAARELPGAAMARALIADHQHVYFVTAASWASAVQVLIHAGLPPQALRGCELAPAQRVNSLKNVARDTNYYLVEPVTNFTYVDDREEGASIAAEAGWMFVHARWMQ